MARIPLVSADATCLRIAPALVAEISRELPQTRATEKVTAGFGQDQGLADDVGGVRVAPRDCDLGTDLAGVISGEFCAFLKGTGHIGVRRPEIVPSEKDRREAGRSPGDEDGKVSGAIQALAEGRFSRVEISCGKVDGAKALQGRRGPLPVAQMPGHRQGGSRTLLTLALPAKLSQHLAPCPEAVGLALRMAE